MPDSCLVRCGFVTPATPSQDRSQTTPIAQSGIDLQLGPRPRPGSRDESTSNVHLEIERLQRAVWREIPAVLLDLIEIAGYVYAADQAVQRGGLGLPSTGAIGQGWRRSFRFQIPVRQLAVWKRRDVRDTLTATLGFLSEDDYEFEFRRMNVQTPLQAGLRFEATPYDGLVDEVMLFSGGLDSLAGAVQEVLVERRKVLLVHHRSTEKLTARHESLLRELEHQAGPCRPIHIPVWLNKDKELGREFTQRSRSFVYVSLAATLASMVGRNRVRFYENGVVSLNLPISAQVVGARATRTTHPAVLNGYAKLLGLILDRPFAVENPFLWETKRQIVQRIADAGCAPWIGLSTSCAHTWTRTLEHPHCGVCSQCIDRRFAVLAAGLAEHDPGDRYAVDLMTGAREDGEQRLMLAGFLERASRVEGMDPARFFATFGEAGRVFREIPGPSGETARRIFELYRRHARDVTEVVDAGHAAHASAFRLRTLPDSCLLRLVTGPTRAHPVSPPPAPVPVPEKPDDPNVFRRCGEAWEVRFAGGHSFILLPAKGVTYLHRLLAAPRKPIAAVDLAFGEVLSVFAGAADAILDKDGITAYRAKLLELLADRERALTENDTLLQAEIDQETATIELELKRAVSPRGQNRSLPDAREKVRKAVGLAIARTLKKISNYDKKLAAHLQSPVFQCGLFPCYAPVDDRVWITE